MGTTLDARVEIFEPATSMRPGFWQCVSVWELQKDYPLMMWISDNAEREWPADFDDFEGSDIWEQRSHIDGELLTAIDGEEWARLECDSILWRSLLLSLGAWSRDTVHHMQCRVLFSKC